MIVWVQKGVSLQLNPAEPATDAVERRQSKTGYRVMGQYHRA